nr:InlB B-repeat-containing protein [Bacteroidales bacterium]
MCAFSDYTKDDSTTVDGKGKVSVIRKAGNKFGNDYFLDVKGGTVATNKGSIDISNSDKKAQYSAINGADVDYLSAKYSTYGSRLNSLRLKNAQDVIALKPLAGSVIYVFGQGNNKTGAQARIPKFATDADLKEALNDGPDESHPKTSNYVYKFEVPKDKGFDGENPLYIGSYNGDAFFSYIIVELPPVEPLYKVTVSASPVEGGLVSAVQEPQQDGVTEVVTLNATTNEGYAFKEWQDAEGNTLSTNNPYTCEIGADASFVAVFELMPTYTVTYGLGESGAVGAAPAAESQESGKTITIPANYTLYKEGYTLTGWTDGEKTYKLGDEMTVTANVALTPVFTQNNVSLATRNDAVTITWDFQRKNGAPTVAWQGGSYANMAWVSQVKVNGETIDVKMGVNAASGKVANANWNDWAQINKGTILSIPACKGATIQMESHSATTTTTIAGAVINQGTLTPTYTYEGSDEQVNIVIGDGSYWRTVKLTLPARTLDVVDREDLVAEGTYAQATYSRTVDPAYNYGTICLPFTPDAETCEKYTFYTLSKANSTSITFVEVDEPQANMPYLYRAKDREATTHVFTGGKTTVNTEAGAHVVGNWSFAGVFAKTVFKPAELNANLYIYKPTSGEDLIVEALNSLTMWPYRAYFKCNQVVAASAPMLRVVIDGGVTGIEEVITPDQIEGAVIYDLMGRPVQQMIEGNFYIVNGEKVLY